jgi:hypothetical protein
MRAIRKRRAAVGTEIEQEYLHSIDGALVEQAPQSTSSARSLAADSEDHRQF